MKFIYIFFLTPFFFNSVNAQEYRGLAEAQQEIENAERHKAYNYSKIKFNVGGNEFLLYLNGIFEYDVLVNQQIRYDYSGNKVIRIGDIDIRYDYSGNKVIRIGDIDIRYDYSGNKVIRIGDLSISYDYNGDKVEQTSGKIR
jgi:hypothetical protein